MGFKIFINAGHFSGRNTPPYEDSGHVEIFIDGTTIQENVIVRAIRDELKLLLTKYEVLYVPDELNLKDSIAWVNQTATLQDFAIDIHLNAHSNRQVSGTEAFYWKDPKYAKVLSRSVSDVLWIKNRGAISDTQSYLGSLGWLRFLKCPSVVLECYYLSNIGDRAKGSVQRAAQGIKNGIDELFQLQEEIKIEIIKTEVGRLQQIIEILKKIAFLQDLINKYKK